MDFPLNPRTNIEFVATNTSTAKAPFNGSKGTYSEYYTSRTGAVNFGNQFSPLVIIGDDTRSEVKDTRPYPYRVICALFMQFTPTGPVYRGTGTLIGPEHIITCAHNCINNGNKVIGMDVVPGHTPAGNYGLGETHAKHVYFPDDYEKTLDASLDYAIIKLASPIGDKLGWMGYREGKLDELDDLPVNVTGYPRLTPSSSAETMYEGSGKVLEAQNQLIFHDVDTQGGQSGAAIFSYQDGDSSDEPTIFGVHTGGHTSPNPEWNIGVRLNEKVLKDIEDWKAQ